jgi:peptidoglycan DL-endopeptidase CwlO
MVRLRPIKKLNITNTIKAHRTKQIIFTALVISVLIGSSITTAVVGAQSLQGQIDQLKSVNGEKQNEHANLELKARNISEEIKQLEENIASTEAAIQKNRRESQITQARIETLSQEIEEQIVLLGINIRQMYLDDQMTTLEKLASSKNLSDFVDKEQYRLAIQANIKESTEKIEQLKNDQVKHKSKIDNLLEDQEEMRKLNEERKGEQTRLLSLNKQQRDQRAKDVEKNNTRIQELQRQQAIENARHFVSRSNGSGGSSGSNDGGGGFTHVGGVGRNYPYTNVHFPNAIADPWGMFMRQCVSYTAWRVAQSGRHMPHWGGIGHANQWPGNARRAGIPVDSTPRVGSVAVSMDGPYGHTMYVEAIHRNGNITISDFNANWDGRYGEGVRTTAGLQFIHFR